MSAADNSNSGGGAVGWFAGAVDWVARGLSELNDGDLPINRKKRRILNRAGYKRVAVSPSKVGWRSPTGEVISGRKALRREVDKLKRARTTADSFTEPFDDPIVFAMAAAGMSAEQAKVWEMRRMASDPKYALRKVGAALERGEMSAAIRKLAKTKPKIAAQAELERARALLRKAGKLAGKVPGAARIARVARGAGPSALLTASFELGYAIGTQIYTRGSAWYYGDKVSAKPPSGPRSSSGRLTNIKITAKRIPELSTAAQPRAAYRAGARPTKLPQAKLEQIKITAKPIDLKLEEVKVTAKRLPIPKQVPKWLSRLKWLQKQLPKLAALQQYKPVFDAFESLRRQRSSQAAASAAQPLAAIAPQTSPLTAFQPAALQSKTCKPCKCSKRKKSTKPRCRNPVLSKRKRNRNGVTVQTITRELRC